MIETDWARLAAREVIRVNSADETTIRDTIARCMPEPPLLQCVYCHNTESCAGAKAREWNHGRCAHCGGAFKVVRA